MQSKHELYTPNRIPLNTYYKCEGEVSTHHSPLVNNVIAVNMIDSGVG